MSDIEDYFSGDDSDSVTSSDSEVEIKKKPIKPLISSTNSKKEVTIELNNNSDAEVDLSDDENDLEDEGEIYEGLEDIWPDYPSQEDFFFNEDEY
jgi:hypothetical protein